MEKRFVFISGLLLSFLSFLPVAGQVTITEIFYDTPLQEDMRPKIGVDLEGIHHNGEFVEIYNNSVLPVDLSGFSLKTVYVASYKAFVFPENTICKPRDFVIVSFRHPNSPDFKLKNLFKDISAENEKKIFYHSSFVLGNRGNSIVLRNRNNEIVSYLQYKSDDARNGKKNTLSVHRASFLSNIYIPGDFGRIVNAAANPFKVMNTPISSLSKALPEMQPGVTDVSQSVGEIKTDVSTTPAGAAQVKVPLVFPAGIGDFHPELAVVYNSQGGLGALGMKTDLSGLSEITRTGETEYFDDKNNPVRFQDGGPYMLDGTRLIRNKNNPALYATIPIHSYTVIEAVGRSGNGPLYFKVTSRDGVVAEYGSESSGRVYANDGVNVLSWKISKVTNLKGNSIHYSYTADAGSGNYIKEIQYTGNTNYLIRFNYIENNYLPSSCYVDGSFFHAKLLLSGIALSAGNSSFEKYSFGYSDAKLVRITENGTSGEKLSLTMNWGNGVNGKKMNDISLEDKENNASIMTGDIDGDGTLEIIQKCSDDNYLAVHHLKAGSQYNQTPDYKLYGTEDASPLSAERCPMKYLRFITDVNSDGIDELVFLKREFVSSTEKYNFRNDLLVYQYNKDKGLVAIQSSSHILGNNSELFLVNKDNDKYADYLLVSVEGRYCLISGKDGTTISGQIPVGDNLLKRIVHLDYNGDGYTELFIRIYDKWQIYDVRNGKFIDLDFPLENPLSHRPFVADVNNDGLQDIVLFSKNSSDTEGFITIAENKGGFFSIRPKVAIGNFNFSADKINCTSVDINGDGLTDLCLVYNSLPDNGEASPTVFFTLLKSSDGTYRLGDYKEVDASTGVSIADLDRDGIPDVLEMSKSKINLTTYSGAITSDLCKVECNGVEKASFKYTFADNAAVHQPYLYNPASGNRCNLSSIKLVSQMDIPNGLGKMGTAYTNMSSSFNYYRGSYLNDGRGFLGFEKSEELCVSNGNTTKTITEIRMDENYFLPVSQKISKTINNQLATVSFSQNTIKAIDTGDGHQPDQHVAVLLTERNDTSFLDNSIVNVKIDYDEYNRISKEITTYDDHSYSITEYKDYSTYDLPQIVTETRKHFQDSKPFVQETKFTYDEHSNLTVKTEYSNTATPVITYNEYDDNGLLKSKRTEATGVESVSESYTYTQEPSRYKIMLKEALSTTCSYYDYLTGNLLEKSVTPNGMDPQTTRHYYNGLGEKTRIVHPNKTEWNISYRWSTSKKAYLESTENETGKPAIEKWYDILGREIYNSTRQGDVTVENATIYNGLGQKLSEINCQPQKSSWTNYNYCADGRLNNISTDIGKYIQYDYRNRTTYLEENGKKQMKTVDSWGNVLQQTDPGNSTVIHQYYSCGKPIRTSLGMHSVTMTYDDKGNQLNLNDPDIGEISYTYDAYDRIKTYNDPKGGYSITYDGYGRIKQKTSTSGRITDYTYYNSGNGIGLPQSIKVNNGTEKSFTYNRYGQILTKREKIESQYFTYSNVYDDWGRQTKHITPNGYVLNYIYDNSDSRLLKVTDQENKILWEQLTDIPGIENSYRIGNTLLCTNTSSKDLSQNQIRWFKSNGSLLHENSYELDPLLGNVTSRTEFYNNRRLTEKFEYDNMDRLVGVSGNASMQIAFDNQGNIISKSAVGDYQYRSGRTHAVTDIENPSELLASKPPQTITYTEFNKIETIKEGAYEMKFVYGPDEQRVKSELYQGNTRIRTIYYGEGFDKQIDRNGKIKEYSYLDAEVGGLFGMAVKEPSAVKAQLYYFHSDILGSLIAISNSGGIFVEHRSYDAWGRRRDPANWNNYTNLFTSGLTARGYIFQEEMPEFELVNLNGRLYDPLLGRMLSPDPYVQNPENSQSYNRYSYCWNNPLKYTDPNGEFFFSAILGPLGTLIDAACWGAVIGSATYTATVALSDGGFRNWDWKTLGKSAGFGALSGVITGVIGQAFGPVGSLGIGGELLRGYTHGFFQGAVSGLAGGDFWSGFASGGLGSLAGSAFMMYGGSFAASNIGTYAFSGLAGGAGSKLTGGRFLDGMVIGLMNAGLNHVQSYIGEARARYFANKKAAFKYMSNTTAKKDVETSGWELENGHVIVLSEKINTRTSSNNSSLKTSRDSKGILSVKFNKREYRIYTHVHTHPSSTNAAGKIGESNSDAAMNIYVGKPLHIIYKDNVYFAKYNLGIIDKDNPYNPKKWFIKKLNYKF